MRRQPFDVLVVGPVARDFLFVTDPKDALAYGHTLDVKEVPVTLAGHGANVAVALARLGVKVGLVAAVGKDPRGDEILEELGREGVDTGLTTRVSLAETGLTVTLLPGRVTASPLLLRAPGANDLVEITEEVQKMLHTTRWVYLASLTGAWEAQLRILLDTLAQEPTKLAWHPGPAQIAGDHAVLRPLLSRTDLLFVSEADAATLAEIAQGHEAVERSLRRKGVKTVVLTHGAEGAHVATENVHLQARPPAMKTIDPRGSGDAFRAAFLAGVLHDERDFSTALRWGLSNAASVAGSHTTQRGLLSRGVLVERLKKAALPVEKRAARA